MQKKRLSGIGLSSTKCYEPSSTTKTPKIGGKSSFLSLADKKIFDGSHFFSSVEDVTEQIPALNLCGWGSF